MPITLTVRPHDARSRLLPVRSRLQVKRGDEVRFNGRCNAGQPVPLAGLEENSLYTVALFDAGPFGDASMFVNVQTGDATQAVHCLVKAKRALPDLPEYGALPTALTDVLERSDELDLPRTRAEIAARETETRLLESRSVGRERELPERLERDIRAGERRWDALDKPAKAGLLNLFAKMRSVTLSNERRTVWSYVERLRTIAPDRIKASVAKELIAATDASPAFTKPLDVPIFHKPDPHFTRAGTWKTREDFGNLQLTFSMSTEDRSVIHVDADVDDAAGIEHVGQVVRNESRGLFKKLFGFLIPGLPDGISHPYDIHQIVVLNQRADGNPVAGIGAYEPSYRLRVDGVPPPYDL